MEFKDKYTSATDKEPGKKVITDDAYALGEAIEELTKSIRQLGARIK